MLEIFSYWCKMYTESSEFLPSPSDDWRGQQHLMKFEFQWFSKNFFSRHVSFISSFPSLCICFTHFSHGTSFESLFISASFVLLLKARTFFLVWEMHFRSSQDFIAVFSLSSDILKQDNQQNGWMFSENHKNLIIFIKLYEMILLFEV